MNLQGLQDDKETLCRLWAEGVAGTVAAQVVKDESKPSADFGRSIRCGCGTSLSG